MDLQKIFQAPIRTTQEKVVASRSASEQTDREFIVESGASLHMMSKTDLTSGEKDTIRRSKKPTVITTASGSRQSRRKKATVYVNDLDVFVTMRLLEDSPAVRSLGL